MSRIKSRDFEATFYTVVGLYEIIVVVKLDIRNFYLHILNNGSFINYEVL